MDNSLNVYLLRHGQTAWNADGNRYCGRTDLPLTAKGIEQAQLVYGQLKNISLDAVYSSPLERAYQTAKIACGQQEVIKDDRLIEFDFGNWEGKTKEQFIPENEELWKRWTDDPGTTKAGGTGETAGEVIKRVDNFFIEALKKHPSGNILVAGHNGINRFYLAHKLGMNIKYYRRIVQENSSVTLFQLNTNGELTLQKLNSKL
jgi:alpha-ribazole phosphatase/probable phosphoglycerate mutase